MTPAVAINAALDRVDLPHVRQLRCVQRRSVCFGTVDGIRTTWFVQRSGARLVCVCYLPPRVRPVARP